jgi:hypothetical protein
MNADDFARSIRMRSQRIKSSSYGALLLPASIICCETAEKDAFGIECASLYIIRKMAVMFVHAAAIIFHFISAKDQSAV